DKTFLESDCLEDICDGFYACHRLDKNTEGLVVLAKTEKIRDAIFECFKQHKIQKNYKAIAFGNIKKQEKFVDYQKKQNDKVYIFDKAHEGCSKIITSYVLEQTNGELSLLDVNIKTGKTHQIRAQLAHHGIFILGDERYGKKEMNKKYKTKKQLLCAYKLNFVDMPKILQNLNDKTVVTSPTFLNKFGF
ncbi:MAG: pseudouridine synthase, partial [Christensenellales bacterium]